MPALPGERRLGLGVLRIAESEVDVPERLGDKRLDAIVLCDYEAQSGELTRSWSGPRQPSVRVKDVVLWRVAYRRI